MPSSEQPRSTRTHRPVAPTKHDVWLRDAEKYIAETSLQQCQRREKKDWILFPGEIVDSPTVPCKKVVNVKSSYGLLSPVPSPRICHQIIAQTEEPSKQASLSSKKTEASSRKRDFIPDSKKEIVRRRTPPPAPSPPRLPTPDLEDLVGEERWSCCQDSK